MLGAWDRMTDEHVVRAEADLGGLGQLGWAEPGQDGPGWAGVARILCQLPVGCVRRGGGGGRMESNVALPGFTFAHRH